MDRHTPVLIGAGQDVWRGAADASPSPLGLMSAAAGRAAEDAGLHPSMLSEIDALTTIGLTVDAPGQLAALPVPRLRNPAASLAARMKASPRWSVYGHMGGNTPQQAINLVCRRIALGESEFALVAGCEFLGSLIKRLKSGAGFADWERDWEAINDFDAPERFGDPREGSSRHEDRHGLNYPTNVYPLFENALRARDGRSLSDHERAIGELFAPFTAVAASHPHAWFRKARSPDELMTTTPNNRMVGYPYPKNVNAIMQVDQSAAVIITSLEKARALGVAADRMVFLHGHADANDHWSVLERQDYVSSPAIAAAGRRALEMVGVGVERIGAFDIYSCFPSAVRIAAEALGVDTNDPRGLSVTGGLPYFGGPGNNYALHSVATMMQRLRASPGSFGLITANGWYLTKHSIGIYSTAAPEAPFDVGAGKELQHDIDRGPRPETTETPEGPARIETYTVIHSREGYRMGIVIGRDEQDRRFVALTPDDEATLRDLESREGVGRRGVVARHPDGKRNLFRPGP
ncbi:acetyl-CoA acetyltransferase [bacterium]|nr:acetyl-CoA acetyltransferase [bacterium]